MATATSTTSTAGFFSNDNSTYAGTADDQATHVAGTIGVKGKAGVAGELASDAGLDQVPRTERRLDVGCGQAADYLTDLKRRHGLQCGCNEQLLGGGGFSQVA